MFPWNVFHICIFKMSTLRRRTLRKRIGAKIFIFYFSKLQLIGISNFILGNTNINLGNTNFILGNSNFILVLAMI